MTAWSLPRAKRYSAMPQAVATFSEWSPGDIRMATDAVYIERYFLGLLPVPASFRTIDPSIPPNQFIIGRITAAGNAFDVDMNGRVDVATDIVYITRRLLNLTPVPPSFRVFDPTIPPDSAIAAKVDALCP